MEEEEEGIKRSTSGFVKSMYRTFSGAPVDRTGSMETEVQERTAQLGLDKEKPKEETMQFDQEMMCMLSMMTEDTEKMLSDVYSSIDANSDGYLTKEDLKMACNGKVSVHAADFWRRLTSHFDVGGGEMGKGDGVITIFEFISGVARLALESVPGAMPLDGNRAAMTVFMENFSVLKSLFNAEIQNQLRGIANQYEDIVQDGNARKRQRRNDRINLNKILGVKLEQDRDSKALELMLSLPVMNLLQSAFSMLDADKNGRLDITDFEARGTDSKLWEFWQKCKEFFTVTGATEKGVEFKHFQYGFLRNLSQSSMAHTFYGSMAGTPLRYHFFHHVDVLNKGVWNTVMELMTECASLFSTGQTSAAALGKQFSALISDDVKHYIRTVYNLLDSDGDGQLTVDDLAKRGGVLDRDVEEFWRLMVAHFGKKKAGGITLKEFEAGWVNITLDKSHAIPGPGSVRDAFALLSAQVNKSIWKEISKFLQTYKEALHFQS